jgi:hypothetical protein
MIIPRHLSSRVRPTSDIGIIIMDGTDIVNIPHHPIGLRVNSQTHPPKEYNGAADVRAYHCFVRESNTYLRDGKVSGCRKVFLLSYHLSGKAYDFYVQKVAINEEH